MSHSTVSSDRIGSRPNGMGMTWKYMNEHEFLQKLQTRAKEQEQVMNGMPFPHVFTSVSMWLGNHPWRLLIPLSFLLSLLFHFTLGKGYDNLILKIFGGIGIVRLLTL